MNMEVRKSQSFCNTYVLCVYLYDDVPYKRVPSSCCSYVRQCLCVVCCVQRCCQTEWITRDHWLCLSGEMCGTPTNRGGPPLSLFSCIYLLSFHLFCRLVTFPPFPPMFIHRYGGGPMVQKLEICSVCKDLLDSYTEQRKREKEEIHKVCS